MADDKKGRRIRRKLKRKALEQRFGVDVKPLSVALIGPDGTRTDIALGDIDHGDVDLDADVDVTSVDEEDFEVVEMDDGTLWVNELPSKATNETARHHLGEVLERLQKSYDAGELECVAIVGRNSNGETFSEIVGLADPRCLRDDLIEMADFIDGLPDVEDSTAH